MSQKVSRKSAISDEKEKKPADSPAKDIKKKMVTAEKEKATDKTEKVTEKEKTTEKPAEKGEKSVEKKADKSDNKAEKDKKVEKNDNKSEKNDKKAEKVEKPTEKKETQQKKEEGSSKEDKNSKVEKEKADSKAKKPQNGSRQNGTNGTEANGVISCDSSDEEQDEMFPELAYDDSDDVDFEPNERTSRSYTRRSQVKATRTPETPRPASDKQTDKEDDSKETKVMKLKEDASTDRKLRSADSPKPHDKKEETNTEHMKEGLEKEDKPAENKEDKKDGDNTEIEIAVEIEAGDDQSRKPDTNFSKSRVKVSPYRRSLRIQDQTNTSLLANYTGNNTTMEMDITESSITEEADDSYLRGLKTIRGRTSYKPLKQMNLRHITVYTSTRSNTTVPAPSSDSRPTGTVVGRKRKPDQDLPLDAPEPVLRKRMRVLDTLAAPFRRVAALPLRRHTEIVGINTDLPLSAPLSPDDSFDPETLKSPTEPPVAVPLPSREERENKRCLIM